MLTPFGSHDNHGLWYDRDGVDQWQATSWENSGANAGRINTGGIYDIVITCHAVKDDPGLGVMFATINGVQQGFYKPGWHGDGLTPGDPDRYPAGISFKGDMKQMQLVAGIYAPYEPAGHDYGSVQLSDISVTGHRRCGRPDRAGLHRHDRCREPPHLRRLGNPRRDGPLQVPVGLRRRRRLGVV